MVAIRVVNMAFEPVGRRGDRKLRERAGFSRRQRAEGGKADLYEDRPGVPLLLRLQRSEANISTYALNPSGMHDVVGKPTTAAAWRHQLAGTPRRALPPSECGGAGEVLAYRATATTAAWASSSTVTGVSYPLRRHRGQLSPALTTVAPCTKAGAGAYGVLDYGADIEQRVHGTELRRVPGLRSKQTAGPRCFPRSTYGEIIPSTEQRRRAMQESNRRLTLDQVHRD